MKKILLIFGVAVLSVALFILLPESNDLQEGEFVQTSSIEISKSENYKHEVFYPEKFSSPPRLEIKFTKGRGYLEIVEQRVDGFIFKASNLGYIEAEGAYVEWTATGY